MVRLVQVNPNPSEASRANLGERRPSTSDFGHLWSTVTRASPMSLAAAGTSCEPSRSTASLPMCSDNRMQTQRFRVVNARDLGGLKKFYTRSCARIRLLCNLPHPSSCHTREAACMPRHPCQLKPVCQVLALPMSSMLPRSGSPIHTSD